MNSPIVRAPRNRLFSTRLPRPAMPTGVPLGKRIAQSLVLAILMTLGLVLALGPLTMAMSTLCQGMLAVLGLDASIEMTDLHLGSLPLGQQIGISENIASPDLLSLGLHWLITFAIFMSSWRVRSKPVRAALQVICIIHAIGLTVITAQGNRFPYTPLDHTQVVFNCGLIWIFMTPWLLAAGFYLIERSWLNRIAASVLILGFELVALPLKLVLHALLIALLSPAVIPTLFAVLGPVLDVILFGALNAWVMGWPSFKAGARK